MLRITRYSLSKYAYLIKNIDKGLLERKQNDEKPDRNGNSNGDVTEIALIMNQQKMISELRARCERVQRDNERLRSVIHSENLLESLDKRPSLKAADQLRHQVRFSPTNLKSF